MNSFWLIQNPELAKPEIDDPTKTSIQINHGEQIPSGLLCENSEFGLLSIAIAHKDAFKKEKQVPKSV
jgi:hypothetical protein